MDWLLFAFLLLCTVFAIFLSSPITWIVWTSTVLGIVASKKASEGSWTTFIFDILSYIVYIFLCLNEKYYGEMILSYIVIFCHMYGILEWKNNTNNQKVKINYIKFKEIFFILTVGIICVLLYSFLLNKINSRFILLNAISTVSFLIGNYFSYRRSVLQFLFWIIYEIYFILLWLISFLNGNSENLIFLIGGVCELIYNFLGVYKWNKSKKIFVQT